MTSTSPIADAGTAIAELLETLGVRRVVYVDDTFSEEVAIEDLIAAQELLDARELLSIVPEMGTEVASDVDIRRRVFRAAFQSLDPDRAKECAKKLLAAGRLKDGEETDDKADASILQELIAPRLCLSNS